MMNGRERSDPAIVAVIPTNKAGQPAAEPGEPRAGTKGNTGQQSTCRAQNRESVSQALDRVRTAARQRKKERFTTLFHHLSIDLFREAFLALRRDAAPGVDGLTWQDYEADLERNLMDLHDRVHRAPGLIQTDITGDKLTDDLKAEIIKGIPLNRLGEADDVARACLFLASDLSSYIIGATIDVNGGMLIH